MQKANKVSLKVSGRMALFSDPITRVGGEKKHISGSHLSGIKRHS